jgi:hypothetical protein
MRFHLRKGHRRTIAVLGGLTVPFLAMAWVFLIGRRVADLLGKKAGLASEFPEGEAIYSKFGDVYSAFGILALAVAAGLSFGLMFWEPRPSQWRRQAVFWIFLLALLPLSFINYIHFDLFVSRGKQALIDVILAFFGAVCVVSLAELKIASAPLRVAKAIALFFLTMQAVIIPALYASLWWLNWQHAISLATSQDLSPGWLSAVAALGSLGLAILTYRRSGATPVVSPPPKSSIIRP